MKNARMAHMGVWPCTLLLDLKALENLHVGFIYSMDPLVIRGGVPVDKQLARSRIRICHLRECRDTVSENFHSTEKPFYKNIGYKNILEIFLPLEVIWRFCMGIKNILDI